jgi:hypothetical protein
MKRLRTLLVLAIFGNLLLADNLYAQQDLPDYNCAPNTLPINPRICIGISETPAYMYKGFLAWVGENKSAKAYNFKAIKPDYSKWKALFPSLTEEKIEEVFQNTDQLALMPIVGITKEQALLYCDWRTEMFKQQLAQMNKRDRARFPKEFKFRLPTANEWGRMRFLIQEKSMLKQIGKIANVNSKAFKLSKSRMMWSNEKITDIYASKDEKLGFYNLFTNVAEMTSTDGEAVGGSWFEGSGKKDFKQTFTYSEAEAWLGFRVIFEIIK